MSSHGRVGRGRFPPAQVAEIKALACELPAESGRPLSRWSSAEIAQQAVQRGIVCSISGTTVWRYLAADAIRPWAWRSWIFPRDPNFAEKAG
nr:helix-turn-helix domain-containing protein [Actinomycetota bacterium]